MNFSRINVSIFAIFITQKKIFSIFFAKINYSISINICVDLFVNVNPHRAERDRENGKKMNLMDMTHWQIGDPFSTLGFDNFEK